MFRGKPSQPVTPRPPPDPFLQPVMISTKAMTDEEIQRIQEAFRAAITDQTISQVHSTLVSDEPCSTNYASWSYRIHSEFLVCQIRMNQRLTAR